MINYYVILEIPNFSEEPIIKKAYRTLSKKYHPDVNKDSIAVDYFLKINEAYDFLMNENKRLLLNQFLVSAHQKQTFSQPQKTQETVYRTPQKPIIHYFSTDRKNFTLHDYILIQWDISQCKSVFINVIGNVNFSGTHYLKIEHFIEELAILMTVVGLDDVEYKYQIKLFYKDDNPYRAAFARQKKLDDKVNPRHFVKEDEFKRFGRIDKKTFYKRTLKCLLIMFLGFWLDKSILQNPLVVYLIILFGIWYMILQFIKRFQDLEENSILKFTDVFTKNSYVQTNNYGLSPIQISKEPSKFSQLGTIGKWSFYSLGFLVFSYIFPFIAPKYYMEENLEHISYSIVERSSGGRYSNSVSKETVYHLHFSDFNVTINSETATGIKRGLFNKFIVGRSYFNNKPIYVEVIPIDQKKLNNVRYYIGINDSRNVSLIYLVLFIFFNVWLLYNVRDKSIERFRSISFGFLITIYLLNAIKNWI